MKQELQDLLKRAYAPYSHFNVGAILICKDNKKYYGVNIENASYPGCICAERVAINTAVCDGYRKGDFKEIHVMASSHITVTPCFICRQTFTEFFDNTIKVYLYNIDGEVKEYTLSELCPLPFDESNLEGGIL